MTKPRRNSQLRGDRCVSDPPSTRTLLHELGYDAQALQTDTYEIAATRNAHNTVLGYTLPSLGRVRACVREKRQGRGKEGGTAGERYRACKTTEKGEAETGEKE